MAPSLQLKFKKNPNPERKGKCWVQLKVAIQKMPNKGVESDVTKTEKIMPKNKFRKNLHQKMEVGKFLIDHKSIQSHPINSQELLYPLSRLQNQAGNIQLTLIKSIYKITNSMKNQRKEAENDQILVNGNILWHRTAVENS